MLTRLMAAVARFFHLSPDESTAALAPLRKHIETVRTFATSVAPRNAITLAVAAAERQFLAFVQFCESQNHSDKEVVRPALDALWAWVRDSTPLPAVVAANLVALFPSEEENDDWPYGYALEYLGSLELLLQAAERYDAEAVVSMADNATNAIDYVLQEASDVPIDTPEWFSQELFVTELARQRADRTALQKPLTPALVDELRQRSQGVSVTGDFMFSPDGE